MKPLIAGLSFVSFVSVLAAQPMSMVSAQGGPEGWTVRVGRPPMFGYVGASGAPYAATEEVETVQRLADGGTITRKMQPVKLWRDSSGRVRIERPVFSAPHGPAPADILVLIDIMDPVGRSRFVLEPVKQVAHRQELPEGRARPAGPPLAGGQGFAGGGSGGNSVPGQPPRPEVKVEQLGQKLVEGVMTDGTRQTMTWPTGAMGNDRPLVSVHETWYSKELGLAVLTTSTDPRNGETTRRLANISRAEPPADLFQAPAGWTVVEEAGEFTIQFPRAAVAAR